MRAVSIMVIVLLGLAVLPVQSLAQQEYTCSPPLVTVGVDGRVEVNLSITLAGPPESEVNITIQTIGDPIYAEARSGDGALLPVETGNGSLLITVLPGVEKVHVYYVALDATSKTGERWSIQYSQPCPTILVLPGEAVPASMQPEPEIVMVNGKVAFKFPAGNVSVSYFLAPTVQAPTQTGTGAPAPGGGGAAEGEKKRSWAPLAGVALALVAAGLGYYLVRSRRRGGNSGGVDVQSPLLDERDRAIVEALRASREGLTASELMEATGIPKTPLYRRLNRLVRQGVIEYYDEGGVRRYRLRES